MGGASSCEHEFALCADGGAMHAHLRSTSCKVKPVQNSFMQLPAAEHLLVPALVARGLSTAASDAVFAPEPLVLPPCTAICRAPALKGTARATAIAEAMWLRRQDGAGCPLLQATASLPPPLRL